jgi:hypothetical protein
MQHIVIMVTKFFEKKKINPWLKENNVIYGINNTEELKSNSTITRIETSERNMHIKS